MSIAARIEHGNELSTKEGRSLGRAQVSSSVSSSQATMAETWGGGERIRTENGSAHSALRRLVPGESGSLCLVRNCPIPKTSVKLGALGQFPIGAWLCGRMPVDFWVLSAAFGRSARSGDQSLPT